MFFTLIVAMVTWVIYIVKTHQNTDLIWMSFTEWLYTSIKLTAGILLRHEAVLTRPSDMRQGPITRESPHKEHPSDYTPFTAACAGYLCLLPHPPSCSVSGRLAGVDCVDGAL